MKTKNIDWENLEELATRFGLTLEQFWNMTPNEFNKYLNEIEMKEDYKICPKCGNHHQFKQSPKCFSCFHEFLATHPSPKRRPGHLDKVRHRTKKDKT